ncbi:MAG TPA: aldolase/citrate lyase family protein [Anaerolineales bacterium]|nr:aldolase/citrate lyase family protein [Anaerolineales bacterium]
MEPEQSLSNEPFQLLLFTIDPAVIKKACCVGIHGFIVDMEWRGKKERQANYDTQVNINTLNDLRRVRANTDLKVICRINGFGPATGQEVEDVIAAGADEIFLPMVRHPDEVRRTLDMIRGRCDLAILVETMDAVRCAETLGSLPLKRVYVGLNDLAIDRGLRNIFESVVDGTVDRIRSHFRVPFGFGGVTLPDFGSPIPARLLIAEMARLNCRFSFLRRSFFRDIDGKDWEVEVPRILQACDAARHRPLAEMEEQRNEFISSVRDMVQG